MTDYAPIFQCLSALFRRCAVAAAALAVVLLAACSGGVRGVDKPFPDLADAPPKPEPSTTKQQRDALRADMTARREQMQNTAQALLRGGTEALSATPPARTVPPPLPDDLPAPPERPAPVMESGAAGKSGSSPVAAPGAADMPEAVAAEEGDAKDGEDGEKEKEDGDEDH